MNLTLPRKTALALSLSLLGAQPASAIPLNGTFTVDNDIQFFTFTLSSNTTTTIATDSYGSGGFVPWLYLWNAYGVFIQQGTNTLNSDSSITEVLTAGTYYGAVYVSGNAFVGLDFTGAIDGVTPFSSVYTKTQFSYNGGTGTVNDQFLLDYVYPECAGSVASNYFVYDITVCENRSPDWSLNITADTPSTLGGVNPYPANNVPEPDTLALALAGLGVFASSTRRRSA